jgi:hypothetical protein
VEETKPLLEVDIDGTQLLSLSQQSSLSSGAQPSRSCSSDARAVASQLQEDYDFTIAEDVLWRYRQHSKSRSSDAEVVPSNMRGITTQLQEDSDLTMALNLDEEERTTHWPRSSDPEGAYRDVVSLLRMLFKLLFKDLLNACFRM